MKNYILLMMFALGMWLGFCFEPKGKEITTSDKIIGGITCVVSAPFCIGAALGVFLEQSEQMYKERRSKK